MSMRMCARRGEATAVQSIREEHGRAPFNKENTSKMRSERKHEEGGPCKEYLPLAIRLHGKVSVDDLRHQATIKARWTAKRLLAIADLLDGKSSLETAREAGVRISTLKEWLRWFEVDGIEGLQTGTVRSFIRRDISAKALQNLAREVDTRIAIRLIAIANLMNGMERREVAAVAQTSMNSIGRWLKAFNEKGLVGLGTRQQRLRLTARHRISPAELRACAQNVEKNFACRLRAIANLLDGMRRSEVAKHAGVTDKTLTSWGRKFELGGIAALKSLNVSVTCRQDISASSLREMAKECDRVMAPRLLAIACLLDGSSYEDVARRASLSVSMIYYLVHRFNAGGISGLARSQVQGRPVKTLIREDITVNELRHAAKKAQSETATRYIAMANLLEGKKRKEVASAARTSIPTVDRWLRCFNADGMGGLCTPRRRKRTPLIAPRIDISRDELHKIAKDSRGKTATRLLAIISLLDGQKRTEVARAAGVSVGTLEIWLRRFNEFGIVGLRHRTKRIDIHKRSPCQ